MPVFRESSVLSPALDPISEADVSQTDLSDQLIEVEELFFPPTHPSRDKKVKKRIKSDSKFGKLLPTGTKVHSVDGFELETIYEKSEEDRKETLSPRA